MGARWCSRSGGARSTQPTKTRGARRSVGRSRTTRRPSAVSEPCRSAVRGAARRQRPRQRRPPPPRRSRSLRRPARSWRACSGSRSRTARTRQSSRRICRSSRMGYSWRWRRSVWRRCARGRPIHPRRAAVLLASRAYRLPGLGCPALVPRAGPSMAGPAWARRVVLVTPFGTVRSARRWWCCRGAVWRWVATR